MSEKERDGDMTEQLKKLRLQEADYVQTMETVVEPYLKSVCRNGMLQGTDGANLSYYVYGEEDAHTTLVLVHGFSEFVEKYQAFIFRFLQMGFRVCALELRGHGGSDRFVQDVSMVYVDDFREYVRDVRRFVKKVVVLYNGKKILLGHSMGGLIAALYIEKYTCDFDGAVLSSPMMQMKTRNVPFAVTRLYADTMVRTGHGKEYVKGDGPYDGISDPDTSSCELRVRHDYIMKKRQAHKEYRTWGASYSWLSASCKAAVQARRRSNVKRIQIPVLFLVAGKDRMVRPEITKRFARCIPSARYVYFENARHEIWNAGDRDRMLFFEEIDAFARSL